MEMKITRKEIERMSKNIYHLCDKQLSYSVQKDNFYNCGIYGLNWKGTFFGRDFIIFEYNRNLPKNSKPMTYAQYKEYIESRGF